MSTIKARLLIALGAISDFLLAVSATGWIALSQSNQGIGNVFNNRVVPLRNLKVTSDLYGLNIVDTAHKVRSGALTWEQGVQSINPAVTDIGKRWAFVQLTGMTPADYRRCSAGRTADVPVSGKAAV
ncbi:hypothetical protein Sp245p_31725 (plasmid) [Azospirillum baldaniorum]|uniref:Uncharacterized protein n=1 Tax=Azospirillum baldaniorum TaxID=1064539 RepID=A0A9P1K1F4_9PROT|nr:Tar ligand binding domain-containing protein [Azospirillum baldaniorum]AWJ94420.1 hypothetical protein Sp245p_31725 [Azospirillum baldaniorum]TWA68327.1 Tar-like ligand binding protein [Azospirillum brasilense]CCD03805.1 exported protein of unknown function [Azospirillum baldaniorum]